jgi:mannobiose 2-epimerase
MSLFFHEDWTPVSFRDSAAAVRERNYDLDHVSFGHDIEAAFLLLEASDALGCGGDSLTLWIAKRMVDHTLQFGWDDHYGGFFDRGYYFARADRPEIIRNTKEWWAQAEGLHSLLFMATLFPSSPEAYYRHFCLQWHYCKMYVLDPDNGGWYWGGLDQDPGRRAYPKATIWKGNYHTSRALINCLRRLARAPDK